MSGTTSSILLVEDALSQLELLSFNIKAAGFKILACTNGLDALRLLEENQVDLIVLDWMLPGISGIEVCKGVKLNEESKHIPVIMLSARTEEDDRVKGLEAGADDYVVKPYSIAELLARIRVQLRRTRPSTVGQRLQHDDIELDPVQHRVFRAGNAIKVGPTEFKILATFLESPGRVWTREQLLNRVWGHNIHVEGRTVDVHIGRLRKALKGTGGRDPIRTVRGTGYSLE